VTGYVYVCDGLMDRTFRGGCDREATGSILICGNGRVRDTTRERGANEWPRTGTVQETRFRLRHTGTEECGHGETHVCTYAPGAIAYTKGDRARIPCRLYWMPDPQAKTAATCARAFPRGRAVSTKRESCPQEAEGNGRLSLPQPNRPLNRDCQKPVCSRRRWLHC
jgi:hypothetical protein